MKHDLNSWSLYVTFVFSGIMISRCNLASLFMNFQLRELHFVFAFWSADKCLLLLSLLVVNKFLKNTSKILAANIQTHTIYYSSERKNNNKLIIAVKSVIRECYHRGCRWARVCVLVTGCCFVSSRLKWILLTKKTDIENRKYSYQIAFICPLFGMKEQVKEVTVIL